ncbi:hypothetical protein OBG91_02320 [Lactococcus lactis]|nr:hypothetical protein [Lactococcus lactis]
MILQTIKSRTQIINFQKNVQYLQDFWKRMVF